MDNEIFVGIEAEGRLRGLPTVFSQRPCLEACDLARERGISHVFFGARGHVLSDEDYAELEKLMFGAIPETWIITLHVALDRAHALPSWCASRCHILLYVRFACAHLLSGDMEVKLENSLKAAIYSTPQMIDLHYVHDRNVQCPSSPRPT